MRWRSDLGAVAVETVFVSALILLPLLAGVTDLGRAFYVSITLEEVAQEAALAAAFEGLDLSSTQDRAIAATDFPALTSGDITASCTTVARVRGDASDVTVTVDYALDGLFFIDLNLQQSATAEGTTSCGF